MKFVYRSPFNLLQLFVFGKKLHFLKVNLCQNPDKRKNTKVVHKKISNYESLNVHIHYSFEKISCFISHTQKFSHQCEFINVCLTHFFTSMTLKMGSYMKLSTFLVAYLTQRIFTNTNLQMKNNLLREFLLGYLKNKRFLNRWLNDF